jgi:thiol-disulfide isomerase/thioredoxin
MNNPAFRRTCSQLLMVTTLVLHSQAALPQASPDPADASFRQGEDFLAAGNYREAIRSFEKANKLRKNACAPCYLQIAKAQAEGGLANNALRTLDKAISFATTDHERAAGHVYKGQILRVLGISDAKKLRLAEAEYRTALELENGDVLHRELGLALLMQSRDSEGIEELKQYLRLVPNAPDVTYVNKLIANPRNAAKEYAPDFTVTTLGGEQLSLSQQNGRIVVLDFWATWCPPCRAAVPELKDLYKRYPREQLVLVSVSADESESEWRSYIAKQEMNWPHYWDRDRRIRISYGVRALPTYMVIGPDGFIQKTIVGLDPQRSVVYQLRSALKDLIPTVEQ